MSKISASGKISLLAALRGELDLKPGDSVVIERAGKNFVFKSRNQLLKEIQAQFKSAIRQPFTVDEFLAEKWAEADAENA